MNALDQSGRHFPLWAGLHRELFRQMRMCFMLVDGLLLYTNSGSLQRQNIFVAFPPFVKSNCRKTVKNTTQHQRHTNMVYKSAGQQIYQSLGVTVFPPVPPSSCSQSTDSMRTQSNRMMHEK